MSKIEIDIEVIDNDGEKGKINGNHFPFIDPGYQALIQKKVNSTGYAPSLHDVDHMFASFIFMFLSSSNKKVPLDYSYGKTFPIWVNPFKVLPVGKTAK